MIREPQDEYQIQKLRGANPSPQEIQHQMQQLLNQESIYNFKSMLKPKGASADIDYNSRRNGDAQPVGHGHHSHHSHHNHHEHHGNHGSNRQTRRSHQPRNNHTKQTEFDEYAGQSSYKSYRTEPAPKNILVLLYTVFTIISCVFLETQYFRSYQRSQAMRQYISYFSYVDGLMCLYSYFITVVISNSIIKKSIIPPSYEKIGQLDSQHSIKKKVCDPCGYYKMPRMSHCNTCATCIYKLDHHCVWTQNCVGYRNQKSFYLFTLYMTIGLAIFWYQTYHTYSGLKNQLLTDTNQNPRFFGVFPWYIYIWWGITCVSASIIGIMIIVLCVSHFLMILTNFTTLDSMKKRRCFPIPFIQWRSSWLDPRNGNLFDRGEIQNMKQIFGDKKSIFDIPLMFVLVPTIRIVENQFTIQKMTPQPSRLQLMKFTNQINRQIDRDHEVRRVIKKLRLIYQGKKMKLLDGGVVTL